MLQSLLGSDPRQARITQRLLAVLVFALLVIAAACAFPATAMPIPLSPTPLANGRSLPSEPTDAAPVAPDPSGLFRQLTRGSGRHISHGMQIRSTRPSEEYSVLFVLRSLFHPGPSNGNLYAEFAHIAPNLP